MGQVIAFVGLGANLGGDPARLRATLVSAWRALSALPGSQVEATSSLWRSAPVDASGPDYLNAAVALRTDLAPQALLRALQVIEDAHGRERPFRNAPRTLDLDLLRHGDSVVHSAELTLPHPRLCERAFVVRPLLEIVGDGQAWAADLTAALPGLADQPLERLVCTPDWPPG